MEAGGKGVQGPLQIIVKDGVCQLAAGLACQGKFVQELLQSGFIEVFCVSQNWLTIVIKELLVYRIH